MVAVDFLGLILTLRLCGLGVRGWLVLLRLMLDWFGVIVNLGQVLLGVGFGVWRLGFLLWLVVVFGLVFGVCILVLVWV